MIGPQIVIETPESHRQIESEICIAGYIGLIQALLDGCPEIDSLFPEFIEMRLRDGQLPPAPTVEVPTEEEAEKPSQAMAARA